MNLTLIPVHQPNNPTYKTEHFMFSRGDLTLWPEEGFTLQRLCRHCEVLHITEYEVSKCVLCDSTSCYFQFILKHLINSRGIFIQIYIACYLINYTKHRNLFLKKLWNLFGCVCVCALCHVPICEKPRKLSKIIEQYPVCLNDLLKEFHEGI